MVPFDDLPNPFGKIDAEREEIAALMERVDRQAKLINTLYECVGLLMRAENVRLDRKMVKPQDGIDATKIKSS